MESLSLIKVLEMQLLWRQMEKHEWIEAFGSPGLKKACLLGYKCEQGYLEERIAHEYPGFRISCLCHEKVDTPNATALELSLKVSGSYCSEYANKHYLVIDNYLGKHQIAKQILIEDFDPETETEALDREKEDWIISCGSEQLQRSFLAGYNCSKTYVQERVNIEYPGFVILLRAMVKVSNPPTWAIEACCEYQSSNSYCCRHNGDYYCVIENYLGSNQIAKLLIEPSEWDYVLKSEA